MTIYIFIQRSEINLKPNYVVQQKKFYNFLKKKPFTQGPEKVIFNFSKYVLSDCEKSLLTKGVNFDVKFRLHRLSSKF